MYQPHSHLPRRMLLLLQMQNIKVYQILHWFLLQLAYSLAKAISNRIYIIYILREREYIQIYKKERNVKIGENNRIDYLILWMQTLKLRIYLQCEWESCNIVLTFKLALSNDFQKQVSNISLLSGKKESISSSSMYPVPWGHR